MQLAHWFVISISLLPLAASLMPIGHRAHQQELNNLRAHYRSSPHQHRVEMGRLSVCTDEDCVQQGAYQTLARLKEVANGQVIQVDSCRCLGMCGLGPCVSIEWDGSRAEPRGGIDASDDAAVQKVLEDAVKPPTLRMPKEHESDSYSEQ